MEAERTTVLTIRILAFGLVILSVLAKTGVADSSAVGTWEGTWSDDLGASGTYNADISSDGTVSGTSYEPGYATYPFSGTYTFNPATGFFTADYYGESTAGGYPIRYWRHAEGYITGDTVNGDEWDTLDAYYAGGWHRQWTDLHGTWQGSRTSLPNKPIDPSPVNGATSQSTTPTLSWTNGGGAVLSGAVVVIGANGDAVIGVALADIGAGETGPVQVEGVFSLPKVSAAVIAAGEFVLWDASNSAFDDNQAIAAAGDVADGAWAVAAAGNGETTVLVKLTGMPGTLS